MLTWWVLLVVFGALTMIGIEAHRKYSKLWALPVAGLGAIVTVTALIRCLMSGGFAVMAVVLILLGFCMVYGLVEQKTKQVTWGRPLAAVCAFLAVVIALYSIMSNAFHCESKASQEEAMKKAAFYNAAQSRFLGDYLASKHKGAKALIVRYRSDKFGDDKLAALKQGAGSDLTIVADEKLGQEAGEQRMFMEYMVMFKQADLEELLKGHADADMMISYCGLPFDIDSQEEGKKLWDLPVEKLPKLVLIQSTAFNLKKTLFTEGRIAVCVVDNPGYRYEENEQTPKDYKEAFKKRFLLITPENAEQLATANARLFRE